ncbi:MAG: ABC transporter ATP-binding protein [Eubacteriales bacterium]|nr:ABC transporter ATP-binding protein [Eubacteriales bacterium]
MKEYGIQKGIRKTLYFLTKKEKGMLACATAITIVIGVLTSLPAYVIGRIGDIIVDFESLRAKELVVNLVIIAVIFSTKLILELVTKFIVEEVDTHSEKRVTDDLMANVMRSDMVSIGNLKTGTINGRVIRCIEALVGMKMLLFVELMPMLFATIAAIIIAFLKNVYVAVFVCSIVPISLLISYIQIRTQKPYKKVIVDSREEIDGKINEILGGLITIRVANTQDIESKELGEITEQRRRFSLRHHLNIAWFNAGRSLLEGLYTVGTVLFCIHFIGRGIMSPGDILVYVLLFNEIAHPLRELNKMFNEASEKTFLINNLWKLYHGRQDSTFTKFTKKEALAKEKRRPDNDIIIRNLSYIFPSTGRKVLNNISMTIREGEHVGIMGYSGSGKTALSKILLRIYHGYTGEIYIRGKSLKDYKRTEISKTIAYLTHDPYIFYGSIRENICYGHQGKITDEVMIEAAKKAEIYDDIMSMENQFNAHVAERGSNLSLGQRQKLGLARLMILRPKIIILDEATSTLDNISENRILNNIDNHFPEQTRISISHRYTTLENCDRIIILNKGDIIYEGAFDKVNTVERLYELHNIQREAGVQIFSTDDEVI